MAKKTVQTTLDLDGIAEKATTFNETMNTASLVGKTFKIMEVRSVPNQFDGYTYVGTIELDGEEVESWLSGSLVRKQLDAFVEADALPMTVRLSKEEGQFSPFRLHQV